MFKTENERWQAVLERNSAADSFFVYAVKTTGIYAVPSSASKPPKRENVIFFETAEAAELAGFRANLHNAGNKSNTEHRWAEIITEVCRLLENSEPIPRVGTIAKQVGFTPSYFHRVFKSVTGVTPNAYIKALKNRKFIENIVKDNSITNAIYSAGFTSNSRFYETSNARLGMKSQDYRQGGKGQEIYFAVGECFMGSILVAQTLKGICAILIGDDPSKLVNEVQDQFPNAELIGANSNFEKTIAQVIGFIEKPNSNFTLPLDIQGTAFQERVWQALREVPPGKTVSYSDLAEKIGSPKSARAVARACASNRIAVAIPCHRVIRSDGSLSGYRWGVERKKQLLDLENED
ncbi:bifunctional DNA-binding transcriptional regulator/O6-methylguanine-DNA methyltransferase Ada [Rosenbergiella australiborealis]|uniref:bifunctional DNA-binding transcriptional regulator/O6-methylguanine-DNA methyltransferase Ada n=1 Tax=Rosenbergiella australiborealis TaxID=1544696 RepID=UPI001F4F049A|nr:bifunctional DNA-binding transcriptional regulator/O6-methylguanine-DNA methyltransferase Ada [Rosenbergiella australiborealis]